MVYFLAFILGLIQALTEFLPISSSAHLILARGVLDFGFADGLTFDVGLHVGTLLAVIVYFHRDIASLIRGFLSTFRRVDFRGNADQRLAWFIVFASIPAAFFGFFFEDQIELYFRHPNVTVFTLAIGGVLFLVAERFTRQVNSMSSLSFRGAMLIGLAQAVALIPGVSRSGITIITGMSQKLRRAEAARFSFLLGAPALAGAGVKKGLDMSGQQFTGGEYAVLAIGLVTAAVSGWLVIRFLLRFLQNHRLDVFAYYRFALAAAIAVWLAVQS
jgi:undecaprenyl-diphosphatase